MILEKPSSLKHLKRRMDKMIGGSRNSKSSQRIIFLILALGIATVSVMLLGKLREGRVFGLLLRDQDQRIMTLRIVLEREREISKALRWKLEGLRSKMVFIKSKNTELSEKLMEAQTTSEQLQKIQQVMEKTLEERQKEIETLSEKLEELNPKAAHLTELLKIKEAELKEVHEQLDKLSNATESSKRNGIKSEQREETATDEVQTNGNDDNGSKGNNEMGQETPLEKDVKEVKENEVEKGIESEEEAKEEQKEITNDNEIGENPSKKVESIVVEVKNNVVQVNEAGTSQEIIMEVNKGKNELSQKITYLEGNKQKTKEESMIDNEMRTNGEAVNDHRRRRNKKGKGRRKRTAMNKSKEIRNENENIKVVEDDATYNGEENSIKVEAEVADQSNQKVTDDNKVANEEGEGKKIAEGDSSDEEVKLTGLIKEQLDNSENHKEFEVKKNNSENGGGNEMNVRSDKPQDPMKMPQEENAGHTSEASENDKMSNVNEEIGMISDEETPEKPENSNKAEEAAKDQTVEH